MSTDKTDLGKEEESRNPLVKQHKNQHTDIASSRKGRKNVSIAIVVLLILLACAILAIALLVVKVTALENTSRHRGEEIDVGKGAVVSDHESCSTIGRDILAQNGSAVDAAIATLICNGVMTPHSMGIGGGCFMVIYDKTLGKSIYIDGRETGPKEMSADQFYAHKKGRKVIYKYNARRAGVPGELLAYKAAHDKYGRLRWRSLFQPTLDLMEDGMVLRDATHTALHFMAGRIKMIGLSYLNFTALCDVFCSDTKTGALKKAGEKYYMPKLRETLQRIAEQGPDYLYNGPVTSTVVQELRDRGSLLTEFDFRNGYEVKSGDSLTVDYGDYTLYTMGGATGGPIVAEILNVLEGYNLSKNSLYSLKNKTATYHRIIESMKFAYGDKQLLEDPAFGQNVETLIDKIVSKEYAAQIRTKITDMAHDDLSYYKIGSQPANQGDMGTSHVSVLSPSGDAISVTSTINWYFGCLEMSESTGILWNNEMDDFASKDAPVNVYAEGKRPSSSMSPVILVNKQGNVRLVTGASGGSRITAGVAQVTAKMMWMEDNLRKVIDESRIHHGLVTLQGKLDKLEIERGFNETNECLVRELQKMNHDMKVSTSIYMNVIESIFVHDDGTVERAPDNRKLHNAIA